MATRTTPDAMFEMQALVKLAATRPTPREVLEAATMEVQQALDEHLLDLADGASASANFTEGCIEIDALLTGGSTAELHQRLALILTQLDQYCSVSIAPPPMAVRSHEAHVVPSRHGSLVPA
jgi:hypothetical protein